MAVPQISDSFLIYQPKMVKVGNQNTLTPGLWQDQLQKLNNILTTAPAATPAAQASHPGVGSDEVSAVPDRQGKVLGADNFLKADQYPGLHSKWLQDGRVKHPQPLIEGAPNYRELGEGIHGTAQPTIDGMRSVLQRAGSGPGGKIKSVWTNLREEPVVYINGKPLNLRHIKAPYNNQASPGRSAREVDQLEKQLKQDILKEAQRNGGYIITHDEDAGPPPKVVEKKVKLETVQTVGEVYKQLQTEGYNVEYKRLPVTDMKKPEDHDIDELVKFLKKQDPDSELIFNCHAGQGRTTTAMVLASIIRRGQMGDSSKILKDANLREDIKEQGDHRTKNYRPIMQAIRDTQKLLSSQEDADEVIARYGDVQNLKEEVGKARKSADSKTDPQARQRAQDKVLDYLERYHTIITFDRYAQEQGPDFKMSYSDWKKQHPDIDQNLTRLQLAAANTGQSAGSQMA